MESGIFWICSPKWVFLIFPWRALAKPRAWPGDCHHAFLYSNSLTRELGIFLLHHLVMRFSRRKTAESVHLYICELKTLPVGDSLDQQPRFPGCRSPCANTRGCGSRPDFNENYAPNHKVIYGFGLAPPPKFYGVLLFSDHSFPSKCLRCLYPFLTLFLPSTTCIVRLVQGNIISVLQTTKRRQSWSDLSLKERRSDPDLQLGRSCEYCSFAQTIELNLS